MALEGGEGSASRPGRFTPGKEPVPIVQETRWAPGPFWTGAENLAPTGIRSPYRPARSQSLYRLSYSGPPLNLRGMKSLRSGWNYCIICISHHLLSGRTNKAECLGGAYYTCQEGRWVRTGFWWGNLKKGDHLEKPRHRWESNTKGIFKK